MVSGEGKEEHEGRYMSSRLTVPCTEQSLQGWLQEAEFTPKFCKSFFFVYWGTYALRLKNLWFLLIFPPWTLNLTLKCTLITDPLTLARRSSCHALTQQCCRALDIRLGSRQRAHARAALALDIYEDAAINVRTSDDLQLMKLLLVRISIRTSIIGVSSTNRMCQNTYISLTSW